MFRQNLGTFALVIVVGAIRKTKSRVSLWRGLLANVSMLVSLHGMP